MYEQVEKSKENKSKSIANSVDLKKSKGKQGFGFVDNRPEAVAQRKLKEAAGNIPQSIQIQLKSFPNITNNNPKATQTILPSRDRTPVQRRFKVGGDTYTKSGANITKKLLESVVSKLEADGNTLGWGWKGKLKEWAGDNKWVPNEDGFTDLVELINALEEEYPEKTKEKKPKFGELGYIFKPQTDGKMFDCMNGVKDVNSKKENKIKWGHIGMEREEIEKNACGANNMGYVKSFDNKDVDTIDKETLHESMTDGQMAGSFLATNLLDLSGLKSEMTELQMVNGVDDKGDELLIMGGNTNEGNESFRKFIPEDNLSKMYKSKFGEENKVKYLEGLNTLYESSEEFQKDVDDWMGDDKELSKKRKRYKGDIGDPEFRKKRKLRNSMKLKPQESSTSTYGDMKLIIPDNPKDKHTETNILHYAKNKSIEVQQAVGTKIPCLSCFAAFCEAKKSDALLPGFGYLWFSDASISQHVLEGIDNEEFSSEKAVEFLNFIEKCITDYLKEKPIHRYTGHMGDINPGFEDDDSGSEGEECWGEFYKSKRVKK